MADNLTTQTTTLATIPGSSVIATDDAGAGGHVQLVKLAISTDGSATALTADNTDGLLVNLGANNDVTITSGTVTANLGATDNAVLDQIEVNTSYGDNTGGGVEAGALRVTIANDSTGVLSVDDGGGVLSVDWNGTAPPIGAGTEAAALRVTLATDSTGLVSIDDNGGSLTVDNNNTVSTNNSTTTPLAGDAVFTGTGDDCQAYSAVAITLDSSHDSATDGMTFQFSTDNTNWDDVYTFTYTAADGARRFQFPVTARYFRVVYTNGSTLQTHFRVQTILHTQNILTSVHRLVDNTDPDRSAQVVKAALIAQAAGSGDFIPVQSTAAGNLKISIEEVDATNLPTNTVQLGGTAISTGNGATDAGTQRVTISSDSTGVISVDDNAGSLTVDNAALSVTGGGVEASALRVTLANDSTGVISVDDNAGSLTVDNAGTFAVQVDGDALTALQLIDDPVFADDAAFTLASSKVTMAGAIRDDSLTTLTAIEGDAVPLRVSATGALHVTGGGGGTEYTEDAAAPGDPVGTALMLVRDDAASALVSTDGDWVAQRATNYGAAFVQVLDSSGNFINSFGGSGGTSHADDATFTIGSASSITPMGALADETTPDSVDEGDVGVPRMTLDRKLLTRIVGATDGNRADVDASGHLQVDIAADSVGIGGGTQYAVDDALGATPTGTLAIAIRDDALSSLTPVEGDAVGLRVDANGALWVIHSGTATVTDDGSFTLAANSGVDIGDVTLNNGFASVTGGGVEASALRVTIANDSTGVISVDDGGGNLSVDFGGTAPTVSNSALQITGDIGHDTADGTTRPVKVGMKAIAHGTNPTAVAADDRTDWYANRAGIPFMIGGHPNVVSFEYNTTGAQTDDNVLAAISAGTKYVLTRLEATVDNATSVDVGVRLGFGATTLTAEGASGADAVTSIVMSHPGIAAGSGMVIGDGSGIIAIGGDGEELRITNEAPTSGKLRITGAYYTVPS